MTSKPAARAERVVAALDERELDALVVTDLVDVRWLTGFTGTNGACVVTPGARLFLVGDEFQSIYGFRHADVEVYRGVHRRFEQGDEPNGIALPLTGNFRAAPEIVATSNALGATLLDGFEPLTAAAEVFEAYLADFPNGRRWQEAAYWAGRTRLELGDSAAARRQRSYFV